VFTTAMLQKHVPLQHVPFGTTTQSSAVVQLVSTEETSTAMQAAASAKGPSTAASAGGGMKPLVWQAPEMQRATPADAQGQPAKRMPEVVLA
jgi:hypothetical protein